MELRHTADTAGYANLTTCGSVWSCPVCSAKILAHRALDIGQVLGQAVHEGHSLAFVTLTMRHRKGHALGELWDALSHAWRAAITGSVWQADQARLGVLGWVRVVEVTHGSNGWHVHVHAVLVLDGQATEGQVDDLGASMFGRWLRALERRGMSAPLRQGQDWHLVRGDAAAEDVGRYLAKMVDQASSDSARVLGVELTHTQPGRSRVAGTAPVWQLLDDDEFVFSRSGPALRLWHEWEQASKGRKQVGWSNGLRERFAVLEELSDEEVASTELGTADDVLLLLDARAWGQMVRVPQRIPALLDATEAGGLAGALTCLAGWNISATDPRPPAHRSPRSGEDDGGPDGGAGGQRPPGVALPNHRPGARSVGGWSDPPDGSYRP